MHKIKVINPFSFSIGNTLDFKEYEGNGLVRNMKLPITINFKRFEESVKEVNIDQNLEYYDFSKGINNRTLHHCFKTLDSLRTKQKDYSYPGPWNWEDSEKFITAFIEGQNEQK